MCMCVYMCSYEYMYVYGYMVYDIWYLVYVTWYMSLYMLFLCVCIYIHTDQKPLEGSFSHPGRTRSFCSALAEFGRRPPLALL